MPKHTVTLAELTRRLGLPEDRQDAVAAWVGDPWGTIWTEDDAAELVAIWAADQARIAAQADA